MAQIDSSRQLSPSRRLWRFINRPWDEKAIWFRCRWEEMRFWRDVPVPIRLPFGAWWIARNDCLGQHLRKGDFELAKRGSPRRFLRPDMVMLDIGANQGLYTLLGSKLVAAGGTVYSYEPSERERKTLSLHLRLNRCRNVKICPCALGKETTEADLFVVDAVQAGCNSLRPPVLDDSLKTTPQRVQVMRLDDQVQALNIDRVDFIKLDVEGGELAVLEGARQLLSRHPRPVILAEVQDIRTAPWGYAAREIVNLLESFGYNFFRPSQNGGLLELDTKTDTFDLNIVAIPKEQTQLVVTRINASG